MTDDSSAETQAEDSGQTVTAPPEAAATAQAEVGEQADAQPAAAPVAESNGHAETNGHAEAITDTDSPAPTITPDAERPAFGPRILGIAEPVKPLPSKTAPVKKQRRRRRPSAAERHRRAFFSALTELRRSGKITAGSDTESPADDAQATAAPEAPQGEAAPAAADATPPAVEETPTAVETPAAAVEAPAAAVEPAPAAVEAAPAAPAVTEAAEPQPEPETDAPEPAGAQSDGSASSPARVAAAMERVGGPEVIKEALKPKQDEKGQPLKWAAVCAQAAEGLKPGDPVFNAWVRLAATPVREVKAQLPRPPEQARPAGREAGRRNGGQRSGEPGGRRDRPRRDDRASRQAYASHAQDGTLRKSIRIVTGHDEDQERRERERVRKEQREAKRRAERERLARLGY